LKQRGFERRNKKEDIPRGQRVFEALLKGVCVDCFHKLINVTPRDLDYQGKNHKRCLKCGWQAQWGEDV